MTDWSHYMGVICVRIIRVLALLLLEARYHRAGRGHPSIGSERWPLSAVT